MYAQLSQAWIERGESKRADELIAWASTQAAKVDGHAQRADVYIHLADVVIARGDVIRAFEFLEAAAADINAAEQFNPRGQALILQIKSPKGTPGTFGISRSYSLLTVITRLAKTDLSRAINAARSLTVPEPRALSVIAACREALAAAKKPSNDKDEKKDEPPATKKPDKLPDSMKGKEKNA
ncbi:MAG: hypothetical protein WBV94_34650 [Blastocatellia bacterium]